MSIDCCSDARQIIESQFTLPTERVTGDEPESASGVYVVRACAQTYERGQELVALVGTALGAKGLSFRGRPTIEVVGDFQDESDRAAGAIPDGTHAELMFPVDVDGIRGAL